MRKFEQKKKVIIIGGGISGLTSGVYLLDNGYDVSIYEKHSIPGGACTGWVRDGQYIDGCAHWIIGTNPNSCLRPVFQHIGAFDDSVHIYDNDIVSTFDLDGTSFSFHSNIRQLEKDLIALSKEDERQIKQFIRTIEAYTYIRIPLAKPLERMNPFEFTAFGAKFLPALFPFLKYKKMSVKEYAKRFKDKRIADLLIRFMGEEYNMHSLFYVLQAFCTNDAGIPEGGSLKMATRVAKNFSSLGGKLHLNSPVARIEIEGQRAKGITLESGEFVKADYVIAACDTFETFSKLAPQVKMPKFFASRYAEKDNYLLQSAFQFSFKTNVDLSDWPRMMDYAVEPFEIAKKRVTHFAIRNYAFDKSLSRGGQTLLTVLILTKEETYDYLASLSKEDYEMEKREIGEKLLSLVTEKMGLQEGQVTLLDTVTPLTYRRYTNAHKGAYMSFVTTAKSKGLMTGTILKGYQNLLLGGQWLMPPGGLPIAVMIGKHAAYNVCHLDKKAFVNREERKSKGVLKTTPSC